MKFLSLVVLSGLLTVSCAHKKDCCKDSCDKKEKMSCCKEKKDADCKDGHCQKPQAMPAAQAPAAPAAPVKKP